MSFIAKERIGLPIWEGDFVKGTKHFYPGSPITSNDFAEARQTPEDTSMLIEYNCWTHEQYEVVQQIQQIDEQLTAMRAGINGLHVVDLDKMEITVAQGREDEHARLLSDINEVTKKRNELEAELNAD